MPTTMLMMEQKTVYFSGESEKAFDPESCIYHVLCNNGTLSLRHMKIPSHYVFECAFY